MEYERLNLGSNIVLPFLSVAVLVERDHGAQATRTIQQEKEEERKKGKEIWKKGRKEEEEVKTTLSNNAV